MLVILTGRVAEDFGELTEFPSKPKAAELLFVEIDSHGLPV
jgi:hypothetical protein